MTRTTGSNNGGGGGDNGGGNQSNHEYVDLGLPSGTLWATCNLGADTPEGYGDYFAWGEIQPKDSYEWDTYQYCNGIDTIGQYTIHPFFTKYCNDSNDGYNGFVDNKTILEPVDDAATVNWSESWRMPTQEDWQELIENTTFIWTTQNGVPGTLFTASNGNSLFLPAAGSRWGYALDDEDSEGEYWSSTLNANWPRNACALYINYMGICVMDSDARYTGCSVRPVRSAN